MIKLEEEEISLKSFELLKVLGRGAFGKVMLVKENKTEEIFALKALRKDQLIDKEQTEHTKVER
jgi:serine/threonine protein kinase